MPKLEVAKSVKKPEFASYKLAGTEQGEINALVLRATYERNRSLITLDRHFSWLSREKTKIEKVRGGYPTKRVRNEDIPSHRGVAFSNFLNRFKTVGKKIKVLHATRGWKHYA